MNLSILVPPAASLAIPVSCVEAGRWRWRTRAFSAAQRTDYAAGRGGNTLLDIVRGVLDAEPDFHNVRLE